MSLPEVVSREEWVAARTELLVREKELTRARDRLNADRRRLPMVKVEKDYEFQGPEGTVGLADLFHGHRQLILRHFMFDPSWEDGCPSCSAGVAELSDGLLEHLHVRDTNFVVVSRAPLEKLERYKTKKGWTFPWYSSYGSDFNYDFHVTIDADVVPVEYNYKSQAELEDDNVDWKGWSGEQPGQSCFLRVDDEVFHTYSNYARGAEMTGGSHYFLDLTALGRQEEWEEPKDRAPEARGAVPDFAS